MRYNNLIVVENVRSSELVKAKIAVSALDMWWYVLRNQLDYKSERMLVDINEKYTTQICSCCGEIS